MPFTLRRLAPPALGLALAAGAGCGTPISTTAPQTGRSPTTYAKADPARPVELAEVSSAGLNQAVAGQKGKVVLLDAWFLACGPCVKKFPHVVELAEKYGPDGLAVMSVDVFEDELKSKDDVVAFLRQKGAAFPNYILTDPDAFLSAYGIRGTPAVVLFDRAGQRVKLSDKPTDDEVEAAIRTALRAGGA